MCPSFQRLEWRANAAPPSRVRSFQDDSGGEDAAFNNDIALRNPPGTAGITPRVRPSVARAPGGDRRPSPGLPGVNVELINEQTADVRQTSSNREGLFTFSAVPQAPLRGAETPRAASNT
jgi:hypothetical protein